MKQPSVWDTAGSAWAGSPLALWEARGRSCISLACGAGSQSLRSPAELALPSSAVLRETNFRSDRPRSLERSGLGESWSPCPGEPRGSPAWPSRSSAGLA